MVLGPVCYRTRSAGKGTDKTFIPAAVLDYTEHFSLFPSCHSLTTATPFQLHENMLIKKCLLKIVGRSHFTTNSFIDLSQHTCTLHYTSSIDAAETCTGE